VEKEIESYFDRLWGITRSITGKGFESSLKILSEIVPFDILKFKTGSKVNDWQIPYVWNIKQAYILDSKGKEICNFKNNNLHIVSYSQPIKKYLKFNELKNHIFFLKNQPNAIPYITSYYKKTWGFCISYNQYKLLNKKEKYFVNIDSNFSKGNLIIGQKKLSGASKKEILLSSYLCHPSMANNELSGPLVLSFIYKHLKKIKNKRFSYRFVLLPETIGSIALLSRFGKYFKKNLIAGFQITCVGDKGDFTFKKSREGNTLADIVGLNFMSKIKSKNVINFDPAIGSDERQYCSPGYNLPVASLMKTPYQKYPQYHTSLDNKDFMSFKGMKEVVNAYLTIIYYLENNFYYKNQFPYGEPFLSKRNIYRTLSTKERKLDEIAIWWLLSFSDGWHDLFKISEKSGVCMDILIKVAKILVEKKLLKKIKVNE